uniref:Uncharacterized protein n=1 Tax=Rhizophagus irregularis (strain DAOM 181602 / DAOM 197198 / MUCL 43194) TaxID=747089 RepID=U9SY79_RHIID
MANISSSSFSSFEDSEYDESFLYDNFVEREDFSISFDSIENISKTEEIADNEEVQTRLISDVWKYFTRKEQVKNPGQHKNMYFWLIGSLMINNRSLLLKLQVLSNISQLFNLGITAYFERNDIIKI